MMATQGILARVAISSEKLKLNSQSFYHCVLVVSTKPKMPDYNRNQRV